MIPVSIDHSRCRRVLNYSTGTAGNRSLVSSQVAARAGNSSLAAERSASVRSVIGVQR